MDTCTVLVLLPTGSGGDGMSDTSHLRISVPRSGQTWYYTNCLGRSERDPSFSEWPLGSKEEEVVFREGEKRRKVGKESGALYEEANIRKSSECRNAYAAHTHAFLEQE